MTADTILNLNSLETTIQNNRGLGAPRVIEEPEGALPKAGGDLSIDTKATTGVSEIHCRKCHHRVKDVEALNYHWIAEHREEQQEIEKWLQGIQEKQRTWEVVVYEEPAPILTRNHANDV